MIKELLKDTKLLTSAGSVVIALALIWLIAGKMATLDEALRLNAEALAGNTAITVQFQSLLLELSKNTNVRASLMESLSLTK